jgi:hypothetical protein
VNVKAPGLGSIAWAWAVPADNITAPSAALTTRVTPREHIVVALT